MDFKDLDVELFDAIKLEEERQARNIELIASENNRNLSFRREITFIFKIFKRNRFINLNWRIIPTL